MGNVPKILDAITREKIRIRVMTGTAGMWEATALWQHVEALENRIAERDADASIVAHLRSVNDRIANGKSTGAELSDAEVAGRVRMLCGQDLDHEIVCVMGRDRIIALSNRIAELTAPLMVKCPACDGQPKVRYETGCVVSGIAECSMCRGTGSIPDPEIAAMQKQFKDIPHEDRCLAVWIKEPDAPVWRKRNDGIVLRLCHCRKSRLGLDTIFDRLTTSENVRLAAEREVERLNLKANRDLPIALDFVRAYSDEVWRIVKLGRMDARSKLADITLEARSFLDDLSDKRSAQPKEPSK